MKNRNVGCNGGSSHDGHDLKGLLVKGRRYTKSTGGDDKDNSFRTICPRWTSKALWPQIHQHGLGYDLTTLPPYKKGCLSVRIWGKLGSKVFTFAVWWILSLSESISLSDWFEGFLAPLRLVAADAPSTAFSISFLSFPRENTLVCTPWDNIPPSTYWI